MSSTEHSAATRFTEQSVTKRFEDSLDCWLPAVLRACAVASATVVMLIAVFLVRESLPALESIGPLRFFSDSGWHPTDTASGSFNLTPMLIGTMLASVGAVMVAAPLGIASAVFCHFAAPPRIAHAYRRLVELLAGIPSVVYGFWGLTSLVPWLLKVSPPGQNLLAGVLVLAIMILPTVALMSDAALAAVPRAQLAGAHALGLGRATVVARIALPRARAGITTGILLAAGRAIGETMAVLMVCGNVVQVPAGLFDPVRTLTANIALEMGYATGDHRAALFATGLLLLLLVTAMVLTADALAARLRNA